MNTSLLLARIFGPYCMIVALSFILRRQDYAKVVDGFLKDPMIKIFGGAVALLIGLLVVNIHNVWVLGWAVIVTLIGWLSLIKGVVYFIFPDHLDKMAKRYSQNEKLLKVQLMVTFALGLILTLKGYGCFTCTIR